MKRLRCLFALVLTLCLPVCALTSCTPGQSPAQSAAALRSTARASYAAAVIAHGTLTKLHGDWMHATPSASPEELKVHATISQLLTDVHDNLAKVRPWVDGGAPGSAPAELVGVIAELEQAAALLQAGGQKLPSEFADALSFARSALGGGS